MTRLGRSGYKVEHGPINTFNTCVSATRGAAAAGYRTVKPWESKLSTARNSPTKVRHAGQRRVKKRQDLGEPRPPFPGAADMAGFHREACRLITGLLGKTGLPLAACGRWPECYLI